MYINYIHLNINVWHSNYLYYLHTCKNKLMNSYNYRLIAMHAHLVSVSLESRSTLRIILLREDVVC